MSMWVNTLSLNKLSTAFYMAKFKMCPQGIKAS